MIGVVADAGAGVANARHVVQRANPSLIYRYDVDPERAAAARIALLDEVRSMGGTIGTAHLAEPFTAVR